MESAPPTSTRRVLGDLNVNTTVINHSSQSTPLKASSPTKSGKMVKGTALQLSMPSSGNVPGSPRKDPALDSKKRSFAVLEEVADGETEKENVSAEVHVQTQCGEVHALPSPVEEDSDHVAHDGDGPKPSIFSPPLLEVAATQPEQDVCEQDERHESSPSELVEFGNSQELVVGSQTTAITDPEEPVDAVTELAARATRSSPEIARAVRLFDFLDMSPWEHC
jgi:hypothetical protein